MPCQPTRVMDVPPAPQPEEAPPRALILGASHGEQQFLENLLGSAGFLLQSCRTCRLVRTSVCGWAPDVVLVCSQALDEDWTELLRKFERPEADTDPRSDIEPPAIVLVGSRREPVEVADGLAQGAAEVVELTAPASDVVARIQRVVEHRADLLSLRNALKEDELTGLDNRRSLADRERELEARMARNGIATTCIVVDVDRFKQINDTYGHEVGDAALRCIARRLRATCRASDFVFRIGGDEFLILAPADASMPVVPDLGHRLCHAIGSRPLTIEPATGTQRILRVTITAGVATWNPQSKLAEALASADHDLLARKRRRRTGEDSAPDRQAGA